MKQADVVLLGFPLMHPMSADVRRNDLEMYEPVTALDGPAMTWVRSGAEPEAGSQARWLFPAASPISGHGVSELL